MLSLESILTDARGAGDAVGPTALLASLAAVDVPFEALLSADVSEKFGNALQQDFSFLNLLRYAPDADGGSARRRCTECIRWVLGTISRWHLANDMRLEVLGAVLMTSRLCAGDVDLWRLLNDDDAPSAEFVKVLSALIAKREIAYRFGDPSTPIWQHEFMQAFDQADATEDWNKIAAMWPRIAPAVEQGLLFPEMVRCLARFGFAQLVEAADGLKQVWLAFEIAKALPVGQRLSLAIASSSARLRFCCAFVTVSRLNGDATLGPEDQTLLTELLVAVSASMDEWLKWMQALNAYPVRYPALQRPLGSALSKISHDAGCVYIDSIELRSSGLSHPDRCRDALSVCLREFSEKASPEHRAEIWHQAYKRWNSWQFKTLTAGTYLSEINRSSLDFAVVSYARDILSARERETEIEKLQTQFIDTEQEWYRSETDIINEFNRLLSIHQIYAHAQHASDRTLDAIPDTLMYYPFDVSQMLYLRIKFRISLTLPPRLNP